MKIVSKGVICPPEVFGGERQSKKSTLGEVLKSQTEDFMGAQGDSWKWGMDGLSIGKMLLRSPGHSPM